jgi:hypothetical protein
MNHRLRPLVVLLLLVVGLVACRGDDTAEVATATPADLATSGATIAATNTAVPLPTSTLLPTAAAVTDTPVPLPTDTPIATATEAVTAGSGQDQGQDASMAATAAAAAAQGQSLMGPWQGIIGVAVLNQTICATLQRLAQAGQQGGLGALAVPAGLLGVGQVLQSGQQQLGGLLNTPGLGQLLGSLQADQASLSDVVTRWSGGQMDAATAGAALQVICGATDATLAQSQQSAQDAGATQEQVGSMLDQSKRDAAGSLGGLAP